MGNMNAEQNLIDIITLLSRLIVFDLYDFKQFLKRLIKLLTRIVDVDSCFIYIRDIETKQLTLVASKKPKGELVGSITLQRGEGITGWVAEHVKSVVIERQAYKDKRFKPFKELPEDRYEAFLSVPILNKEGTIGVVNFQNKTSYSFSRQEIKLVEAAVKIIASAFEKIVWEKRVVNLENKLEERKQVEKAKGILMKRHGITEREAYNLIQKESMKKRKIMKEIAEAVLLVYE
jgi:uroporphyrinogen-III synthase